MTILTKPLRRRLFRDKCDGPIFYAGTSSSPLMSTEIISGSHLSTTKSIYFFASCKTLYATLTYTIKIYNSNGTQYGSTQTGSIDLNNSSSTMIVLFSSSNTIPTGGGYAVIEGYCKSNSTIQSPTTTVILYNQQVNTDLVVTLTTPSGTYDYSGMLSEKNIYANFPDACDIRYTYTQTNNSQTPADPADPTVNDPIFDTYLEFDRNTKIKLKAFAKVSGFNDSSVVSGNYVVEHPPVTLPSISTSADQNVEYNVYQTANIRNENEFGMLIYRISDIGGLETTEYSTDSVSVTVTIKHPCRLSAVIRYSTPIEQYIGGRYVIGTPSTPLLNNDYVYTQEVGVNFNILFRPAIDSFRILSETGNSAEAECTFRFVKEQYYGFDKHEVSLIPKLKISNPIYANDTSNDPIVWKSTYSVYNDVHNEIVDYPFISPDLNTSISNEIPTDLTTQPQWYTATVRLRIPLLKRDSNYELEPELSVEYTSKDEYFDPNTGLLYSRSVSSTSITPVIFNTMVSGRGKYNIFNAHDSAPTINCQRFYGNQNNWSYSTYSKVRVELAPVNVSFRGDGSVFDVDNFTCEWGYKSILSDNKTSNYSFLAEPWSFIGNTSLSDKNDILCLSRINNTTFANNYLGNIIVGYEKVRDLFGWGSNDINNGKVPWQTSTTDSYYYAYNTADADLRNVRSRYIGHIPVEPNTYYLGDARYRDPQISADWAAIRTSWNTSQSECGEWFWKGYATPTINSHKPMLTNQGIQSAISSCDISAYWGLTKFRKAASLNSSYPSSIDWDARTKLATLSATEWDYILGLSQNSRKNDYSSSSPYTGTPRKCFAKGRIRLNTTSGTDYGSRDFYGNNREYINGLFIFSDEFQNLIANSSPFEFSFTNFDTTNAAYSSNTVTAKQWYGYDVTSGGVTAHVPGLENWVTFLPAAGYRVGTTCYNTNEDGYYWTRTSYESNNDRAYALHFNESTVEIIGVPKSYGCSVRLGAYMYYPEYGIIVDFKVVERTSKTITTQCKVVNDGGYNISSIQIESYTAGYYKDRPNYWEWQFTGPRDYISSQMVDSEGKCVFSGMDGIPEGVSSDYPLGNRYAFKCKLNITKTGSSDPTSVYAGGVLYASSLRGGPRLTLNAIQNSDLDLNEDDTTVNYSFISLSGEVTHDNGWGVDERGFCWNSAGGVDYNDNHQPVGSGKGTFSYNVQIPKYPFAVTWYAKSYGISDSWGGANYYYWYDKYPDGINYSQVRSITVPPAYPWVKTNQVTSVNPSNRTATLNGEIVYNSSSLQSVYPVSRRGFCWSTNQNPTLSDNWSDDGSGSGSFSHTVTISGSGSTRIYVRTYSIVTHSGVSYTKYGPEESFTL